MVGSHEGSRGNRWQTSGLGRVFALLFVMMFALCFVGVAPHAYADDAVASSDVADGSGTAAGEEGLLTAYFFSVGEGESEFVVLPDGKTMLIDAGESWAGDAIVSYIQGLGYGQIDYLVATNPASDHVGGMKTVLWSDLYIVQVVAPQIETTTEAYDDFLYAAQVVGKAVVTATAGLVVDEGVGFSATVLSPTSDVAYEDANDRSVVLKIDYGDVSYLFASEVSQQVIDDLGIEGATVLKVGRHGGEGSVTEEGLAAAGVDIAVVEAGWGSETASPTDDTVDALESANVQAWRTDVDGVVVAVSNGKSVSAWGADTGAVSPAGREGVEARKEADRIAAEEAAAAAEAQAEADRLAAEQAAAQAEAERLAAESAAQEASQTVYITNSGSKYHSSGCRYLKKSKISTTLSSAKAQGYTACSVCNPPK